MQHRKTMGSDTIIKRLSLGVKSCLTLLIVSDPIDIAEITIRSCLDDCPKLKADLPIAVVLADVGTQAPGQAHAHAMCAPGVSQEEGYQRIASFIGYQLSQCNLKGLAAGIHAMQDAFAGGHAGCTPWGGGLPSPGHLYDDSMPSKEARRGAIAATCGLIRSFKAQCPCACN